MFNLNDEFYVYLCLLIFKFSWMYRHLKMRAVASLETSGSDYPTDAAYLRRTESSSMPPPKPQNSHKNSVLIFLSM
jgi:hypothetical protein